MARDRSGRAFSSQPDPDHPGRDYSGAWAKLLTISGEGATRIFLVAGAVVQINSVTLAGGLASGGDGGAGTGGAGGGGGAAGMGGAIFLHGGSVTLSGVVLRNNRAVGGNGGGGGTSFAVGVGGAGGDCEGLTVDARSREAAGGAGGHTDNPTRQDGGWCAGGGGGALSFNDGVGMGSPGAQGGFGGGDGGSGGFLDAEGNGRGGSGGAGGAGLGGAVFVSSGHLQMADTVFVNNSSAGGAGAGGAANGTAKGGALFVCSSFFCGPGSGGAAVSLGGVSFDSNSAAEAGVEDCCAGRDDSNVCGYLSLLGAQPFFHPGAPRGASRRAVPGENDGARFEQQLGLHLYRDGALRQHRCGIGSAARRYPVRRRRQVLCDLETLGKQTITATDAADHAIRGTSNAIIVDHIDPALGRAAAGFPDRPPARSRAVNDSTQRGGSMRLRYWAVYVILGALSVPMHSPKRD